MSKGRVRQSDVHNVSIVASFCAVITVITIVHPWGPWGERDESTPLATVQSYSDCYRRNASRR